MKEYNLKRKISVSIPLLITTIALIAFNTIFIIGYVPSASMEPTLKENSLILGLRIYDDLYKGDIIVFNHEGKLLVKRIAAIEGETVDVNGKQIMIPSNSYYVLGDNINNSVDSRFWNEPFIHEVDIVSKVIICEIKVSMQSECA